MLFVQPAMIHATETVQPPLRLPARERLFATPPGKEPGPDAARFPAPVPKMLGGRPWDPARADGVTGLWDYPALLWEEEWPG